jgi:hypothetical protein
MIGHLTETPVATVRVDWMCGADGCEGMMEYAMPPEGAVGGFPHRCSVCGRVGLAATCAYPRLEHRDASGEGESFRDSLARTVLDLAYQRRRSGSWPEGANPERDDYIEAMIRVLEDRIGRAAVKK